MKNSILNGLAAGFIALNLCGCSHHYQIKLTNGRSLTASSRPKLVNGRYIYTDAHGQKTSVSAGNVSEIAPAGMGKSEKEVFKPSTGH